MLVVSLSTLHVDARKIPDHRFPLSLVLLFALLASFWGGCSDTSDGLDTEVAHDTRPVDLLDVGLDAERPEELNRGPCMPCSKNFDCLGELTCHPLGEETFCFQSCERSDDCPSGWMCTPLDTEGYQCVPRTLQCQLDCMIGGCPEGKECDQDTGHCVQGKELCASCDIDWDCAGDLRCHPERSYCTSPCDPYEQCPAGTACQSALDSGGKAEIRLCTSLYTECCHGESCEGLCLRQTPFRVDGVCQECRTNEDCMGEGEECLGDGSCGLNPCTHPYLPVEVDGECVQCQVDEDCDSFGEDGEYWCDDNVCTNSCGGDELCTYCSDPYPACVQIDGIWSCVQCTDDLDCDAGTCDTSMYSCKLEGQSEECSGCQGDAECVSSIGTFHLECDAASGCCFDQGGWCDGIESFCPDSTCVGLMEAMGTDDSLPGMPTEGAFGACSCENPLVGDDYLWCILVPCVSEECLGDSVCVEPTILTDATGGTPLETPGICLPLVTLLAISY